MKFQRHKHSSPKNWQARSDVFSAAERDALKVLLRKFSEIYLEKLEDSTDDTSGLLDAACDETLAWFDQTN